MFSISIFSSPQHFLAMHLGLFENPEKSLEQLRRLLARTKNPALSLLQTNQLLCSQLCPNQSHNALTLIRFLSQLADLSEGVSMATSLKHILPESTFLTEIRHSLTHKIKINPQIVNIGLSVIKKQIKQKYWEQIAKNIGNWYEIEQEKVKEQFQRIFEKEIQESLLGRIGQIRREVVDEWLVKYSSNYQFKQHFPKYHKSNSQQKILTLLTAISQHKKSIAISYLVNLFLYQNNNQSLCQLLLKIFKTQQTNFSLFNQTLVQRSLRRLTFLNYVGLTGKLIEGLGQKIKEGLSEYWDQKQKKGKCKIYRRFNMINNKKIENK